MAPEAAGGEWLALCLERLAGKDSSPAGTDLDGPVSSWMHGQLDRGELFSIMPFELAQ